MLDVNFFDELRIGLATADDIRQWSFGEVKKPETINYRTLKPEKDGLFCEKIFGPTRDWECYCGKYKRVRFKGIICERCGVEVTRAKVRRERMGHIELAAPVTHIWYFKGVPSRLGYLLDLAPKDLEKIIYFAAYAITSVDTETRHNDQSTLQGEMGVERKRVEDKRDSDIEARAQKLETDLAELEAEGAKSDVRRKVKEGGEREMRQLRDRTQRELDRLDEIWDTFTKLAVGQLVIDELLYRELYDRYGDYFTGAMGAEAIQKLVTTFDIDAEADNLRETIRSGKGQKKLRALKRLKVVAAFQATRNNPHGMVLDCVPVIPPDLRPMVQLDGGRFATSDLNDLYRRVINRNNRLKRLIDLGAPEIIVNNEKRMLQEAVDALFDNGRRGRPVTGPGNRPLKSLSDMLKGKQGRFRQNLLGKRVDYSGRSVIVVGPDLKLHQCGLPKQMALELFKPFVMKRLVDLNFAQNIKSAKRMVERARPQVWDVLEEVIRDHPVLLNRAPTLHRLGIQAFEPKLVEGKAIQVHPLVCAAFNADFDGDQMAVHLPLSAEAQAEARILMLSSNNILSPAHGRPIATPSQDMVLGSYYLTYAIGADETGSRPADGIVEAARNGDGGLPSFSGPAELIMALDAKNINLQQWVLVRLKDRAVHVDDLFGEDGAEEAVDGIVTSSHGVRLVTTPGRVLFNEILPAQLPFVNGLIGKKELADLVNRCADNFTRAETARVLDDMKDIGFAYATKAGVTVSIADVVAPAEKASILAEHDERARTVENQFRKGVITDDERKQELVEIWTEATQRVASAMEANFDQLNPIYMMANSGARGNMTQIRQIAGMRGLVANPRGEIIERPIKSNFREGLSVLEYFISTHGARKGLADTALRTADSGYLTRRLVDIAQDLIVREEDCGTERGLPVAVGVSDSQSLYGRTLADAVYWPGSRRQLLKAGTEITDAEIRLLRTVLRDGLDPETGEALEVQPTGSDREVKVRTVLNCEARFGVCAACYGRALAEGQGVQIGEAVGIIAAQSIGEPGTQLTMRTFHTGGVAGEDITHGLPRVVELFEARTPKGKAEIAHLSGVVSVEETDKGLVLTVDGGGEDNSHSVTVSRRAVMRVGDGDQVRVGDQMTAGSIDPHEMLEVLGARETQKLLVREVQEVYRSQGVSIHDKHIELIVRQMLRRVNIIEPGDTTFLPGELVDRIRFTEENRRVVDGGGEPANGRQILMGITKASLATESWLSAASFQETTRVLTEAAIEGKSDGLMGLKENVIIGKLIPAGSGLQRYRSVRPLPTEMPEQILPAELLEQFADGSYGGYPEDEGWSMGEGSY